MGSRLSAVGRSFLTRSKKLPCAGTYGSMTLASVAVAVTEPRSAIDSESRVWLSDLRSTGLTQDLAVERLHELLLRAARFEVARRRPMLPNLRGNELDDIAHEAADDALMSVLSRLDDFRGESRFTTWVYKFALYEAAAKLRRRSWQGREIPLEPETWSMFRSASGGPAEEVERGELLGAVKEAIETALTPRQRDVLVALALNGVPIDVLAERLETTRGALYKTLHDARRKLRAQLGDRLEVID
jgi:RNA polymerase sigma-70 factor (ECF subfamily)